MTSAQPDILLIVLDTQRRDRLSLYGHELETSPHLDEFAQGATIFERAIAPAQWTIPAHGSIFTGLYPNSHQLTQAYQQLAPGYPTLAELLRVNGYHTVAFCNNPMLGVLDNGLQKGFDHFYNYAGAATNRPVDAARSPLRRQAARQFRQFARYVSNQFAHQDWMFRLSLNPLFVPLWSRLVNYKGDTAKSVDDLIAYWQTQRNGGGRRPMFAFLNLMGTHLPYRPPQDVLDRIAPDLKNSRSAFRYMTRFNADAAAWASPPEEEMADWQQHTLAAFYDAEIAHQDVHLGRLFRYLRNSGALDNTMVIVTADHGEGHGDHDFVGHSFVVYQELVHVPLLIHYPARYPQSRRITTTVSTRRIFHTLLEAAGVPYAPNAGSNGSGPSGLSLARSLNGKPDPEAGLVFSEAFPPDNLLSILNTRRPDTVERMRLSQIRRGVYNGQHKLAMVGDAVEGLFDVADDPAEIQNRASADLTRVDELKTRLEHFKLESSAHRAVAGLNGSLSPEAVENLRALGYME